MFHYLNGTVAEIGQNLAVIDCGGVGYACHTTVSTLSCLAVGERAKLYTHCYIREDAFDVFGFFTISERNCFRMLIGVSGVGPKAAVSILSASTPEQLAVAIITGNEKALTVAQGIGKKIAQRIILELKDKMNSEKAGITGLDIHAPSAGGQAGKADDAAAALLVLGYTQPEVSSALKSIDVESLTVEDIIRHVLVNTANRK